MAAIDDILNQYTALRDQGLATNDAWKRVLPQVEKLPSDGKNEVAERIRAYETGSTPKKRIKRLKRVTDEGNAAGGNTGGGTQVYCWNCGKANRPGEVICVHCGSLLKQQPVAATRQLHTEDHQPEHFGSDGTLMLYVRHSGDIIKLRPQTFKHEIIVGRADANNVVTPDVDLTAYGAGQMGVSRMHMTITYQGDLNRIQITDMGSANGLYINGQKMANKEERVLRDGDQLRLGQLVLDVAYQHTPS